MYEYVFFCPIGVGGKPRASLHLGDDQAISISKLSGVCQTALSGQMKR